MMPITRRANLSLAALFLLVFHGFPAVRNARIVNVRKCCAPEETLDISANASCFPAAGKASWNLKVYSPAKKSYLPPNVLPANWRLEYAAKPRCEKPINLRENNGKYVAFPNGSLFVVSFDSLIHPVDYCLDYDAAVVCRGGGEIVSTVRKCCGSGASFSADRGGCQVDTIAGEASWEKNVGGKLSTGYPSCNASEGIVLARAAFNVTNLRHNGTLWIPEHAILLEPSRYCLDRVLERSDATPGILGCTGDFVYNEHDLRFVLYPIGLALSVVFLTATLACGFLLPATHHVLHWRCQTNYVLCLLIGFFGLCVVQIYTRITPTLCLVFAIVIHFFILAAFFWLNTMCFNIWWTFRDLRPQNIEKSQERFRLRLYKLYAWGIPLLIVTIGVILDQLPDSENTLIRPRFGEKKCWFESEREKLPFFNGPIGLLLTVNLVLFILTARELTCGLWKRELVKSTTERAALGRVCMKLVIVMGVTWITDVLSDALGGPRELWYLPDIFNSLQGVFIFIVIGCQPQVYSSIKRLWCFRRHIDPGTAGTSHHHSSTFQGLQSTGDTTTNSITNTTKSVPVETVC